VGLFFYAQKQGGEYMIDIPKGLLYAIGHDEKVRKEIRGVTIFEMDRTRERIYRNQLEHISTLELSQDVLNAYTLYIHLLIFTNIRVEFASENWRFLMQKKRSTLTLIMEEINEIIRDYEERLMIENNAIQKVFG
jgi:hypothetical protein